MKRIHHIILVSALLLGTVSCVKEPFDGRARVPDGEAVTMYIGFGAGEQLDVSVGTKAEATREDEHNVHDLYVLIFREDGTRLYGRYFSYEHLIPSLTTLDAEKNEGWWVDNVTVADVNADKGKSLENKKKTRGVVKISTESRSTCTLVLLANISNAVFSMNDKSALDVLSDVSTLDELKAVKVTLEQDVVHRSNLFLMLGRKENVSTGDLVWGTNPSKPSYDPDSRVELVKLDAKVKFRIKYNPDNISKVTPRTWEVHRVPENCYLFPNDPPANGDAHDYFDAQAAYFEGTETDDTGTYEVFSFYMLENRQPPKMSVDIYDGSLFVGDKKYYLRELQHKDPDPAHGDPYRLNRAPLDDGWVYAKQNATYVKFDLVLTLTPQGIAHMQQGIAEALTTEAFFTVHLGNFTEDGFDDYNTYRGGFYTYDITINNTESIYIEVRGKGGEREYRAEIQPGQEGSLLLTTSGVINCDSHYEYHEMEFNYSPDLGHQAEEQYDNRKKYSWHIKTPFFNGGATPTDNFNMETGFYEVPAGADYRWVKFSLNEIDAETGLYRTTRRKYPGYDPDDPATQDNYAPDWDPAQGEPPVLMDVNQLINYLFVQNELEYRKRQGDDVESAFDAAGKFLVTAFVDEYYYERHPVTGEFVPGLWQEFVNAKPRELHILSDTEYSDDRRSDVIVSSHSIVQQAIQTIYNIHAPDLTSLWGCEHTDEMSWINRERYSSGEPGWAWWGSGSLPAGSVLYNSEDNGRLNSAGIWGLTTGMDQLWSDFMNYEVANNTPELRADKFYQAYSCLTRNRDNNGNGIIDQEELRWYTGSINQLVGMWVGNEALSMASRLYQPLNPNSTGAGVEWRSVIASSTASTISDPMILRSEEGATKSWYSQNNFWSNDKSLTDKVVSVRCLRNVGVYADRGELKDMTEAPYEKMFDQYYDFEAGQDPNGKAWPNEDGTYTIRFTRLNAKSIREYTSEDLPYHSEYSVNNCVYLRFTAQNPADLVYADGLLNKKQRIINEEISKHNDYCPPGYRMPNMTELLMMTALLPSSYWNDQASFPCRTYYSRGYLGNELKTSTESGKIGWQYNAQAVRLHMQNESDVSKAIRCVRDDNMIGDITGEIVVADNEHRRLGEDWDIDLNFFSLSSVIRSVQLKICYTDDLGNKRELELPNDGIPLGSTTIREAFKRRIPAGSIPVYGFMTLRAEVRNAAGITRFFDAPVRLVSDLYSSLKLLPCEYKEDETNVEFPVLITASHISEPVDRWQLLVTAPDKRTTAVDLTSQLTTGDTYATMIYSYDPGTLKVGTYTFQLEAICDGLTTRSEAVSMDVLKVNYDPLSGVDCSEVDDSGDIADDKYKWKREMIQGLDFASGDFIEADMDISRCVFKPVYAMSVAPYTVYEEGDQEYGDPAYISKYSSVGLDNLISFGVSDIGWTDYSFHVYYPAVPVGQTSGEELAFDPVWDSADDDHGYEGINYSTVSHLKPLHIRLDKEGVYWNNNLMEVSRFTDTNQNKVQKVLNQLTNARTLYVGSTEGRHRSRAIYRFVRVVYNGEYSTTRGGSTDFKEDPLLGGNL